MSIGILLCKPVFAIAFIRTETCKRRDTNSSITSKALFNTGIAKLLPGGSNKIAQTHIVLFERERIVPDWQSRNREALNIKRSVDR
jgi:hypothetical protein